MIIIRELPEEKVTHEDGTGHNCDTKGCPMCWNDGLNTCLSQIKSSAVGCDEEKVRNFIVRNTAMLECGEMSRVRKLAKAICTAINKGEFWEEGEE